MPTLPHEQPHEQRDVAEGFGADAGRYDRARPTYPAAVVDRIVQAMPGRALLDVGCGTGIAARLFAAAGCEVTGVDPDPRMAAEARRAGLAVEVARFEDWDPGGRVFDGVIAAQAWHWVDPVAGAAAAARALKPGGVLALLWNAGEAPAQLRGQFAAVYRRTDTGLPFDPWAQPLLSAYRAGAAKAAAGIGQAGGFAAPQQWQAGWSRAYTTAGFLDLVPTLGGHAQIPAPRLAEQLDGLGAAVDAAGGSFTMEYVTVAVSATRAG